MKPNTERLYQLFKYTVYILLSMNVYWFFVEEWAAVPHRFANGIQPGDIIEAFAATIDTLAWVILLLMFELETYVLDDRRITRPVQIALHSLRAICYGFIVYAFYGYLTKLLFLLTATPLPSVTDLCSLVADRWTYAVTLDEYERLTFDNCASFSDAGQFLQLRGLSAVVDPAGYRDIVRLAWVDVINSGVWLLVVAVLEIDVWLQEHGKLEGRILAISKASKYLFYSILFLAAVYWGVKGDFVDFWDAFLWLVAFVFIELNVFEWRRETEEAEAAAA